MTSPFRRVAVIATVALLALPGAAAAANSGKANHGKSHAGASTPSSSSTATPNAYGKACQGLSKKHVKGQKGTPFSQCVTAMAKLASGEAKTARAACKGLSHKHVKGQKGTPFSQCIKAAKALGDDAGAPAGGDSAPTGGDSTPTGDDSTPTPAKAA
jgi:hypothetical protein